MLARLPQSTPVHERQSVQRPIESAYRCWCCKDSALIPHYLVQLYLIPDAEFLDIPMLCRREGCNAAADKGWDSVLDRLDTRATPDMCQQIHATERAAAKDAHDSSRLAESVQRMGDGMAMPEAESADVVWVQA